MRAAPSPALHAAAQDAAGRGPMPDIWWLRVPRCVPLRFAVVVAPPGRVAGAPPPQQLFPGYPRSSTRRSNPSAGAGCPRKPGLQSGAWLEVALRSRAFMQNPQQQQQQQLGQPSALVAETPCPGFSGSSLRFDYIRVVAGHWRQL